MGAVVIEGPKACGKTATARRAAASEVLLDVDAAARQALAVDPGIVLNGKTPRLIDEWQTELDIWNHIRRAVDDRRAPGQFILTGSAIPADDITLGVGKAVEEGAVGLLKFAKKVDTAKLGKPSALAVIVGSGYGYVRPDGVVVIPIGALGA